jgi:uncharacterized protein
MHRKISALTLLLLLSISTAALAVDFKTKPKLAFYPLVARNVDAIAFTEAISTQLFNNIERTDFFEILERKTVEGAVAQDGVPISAISRETLYSVGNRAGFDISIVGKVSRQENAALIDLQVVGSGSRDSYYAETFRIPEYDLAKKLQEVADKIVVKVKGFNIAPPPAEKIIAGPTELEVRGTPRSIKLKWTAPGSRQVIGYAIMRSGTADGSFVQIATTTQPSYTDQNLKLNETFYYKVKAISKSGIECCLSEAVIGKTSIAPHSPIFMEIKSEPAGALLSWYDRPYSGADSNQISSGFQIYRKAQEESDYRPIAKVAPNVLSYLDRTLKNGVLYSYALTSFNALDVESEFSSTLEAQNAKPADDFRAVGGGKRSIALKWTPNANEAVEGYCLYRAKAGDQDFQRIAQVKGRSSNSHLDTGLEDGTSYRYQISALLKGDAETLQSDPVSATTREHPAPPAGLSASGLARKVAVTWKSAGTPEDGIVGYNLFKSNKSGGGFTKIAEIAYGKTSYLDEREKAAGQKDETQPLADGATFYYRISCFNDVGSESPPSEAVSATTRAQLAAPKHLTASSRQVRKVTLSWEKCPEAKQYQVYRGSAGQQEVQELKTVTEPFFVDSSLPDGASYIYAVKQIDAEEITSPLSYPATGVTKERPAVPGGLALTEQNGKKGVAWDPVRNQDLSLYVVYKKSLVGLFQKLGTTEKNFFPLDGLKGELELRVVAEDRDGLESDKSEVLKVELK